MQRGPRGDSRPVAATASICGLCSFLRFATSKDASCHINGKLLTVEMAFIRAVQSQYLSKETLIFLVLCTSGSRFLS